MGRRGFVRRHVDAGRLAHRHKLIDPVLHLRRRRIRAIYVTPHHQFPTTVLMPPDRRMRLLLLAEQFDFAIIEDDYDHEFHYDGRPILPMASADLAGVVVYVGTLSKVLAPGVRVGYLAAPRPVLERILESRIYVDRQGDHAIEWAVAELMDDGEVERHIRRSRRAYERRRGVLVEALEKTFGDRLNFRVPAGGTALWARVAKGIDPTAWAKRALEKGVALDEVYFSREWFLGENELALLEQAGAAGARLYEVSKEAFAKVAYRERPDGILAVAPQWTRTLADLRLSDEPFILVVEAIEKPGNLGTILRSADAAGCDAVIVCDPVTDLFNPNVVRASTGVLFSVP